MATITLDHLHRNGTPEAKVGDGVTVLFYSDTKPGTIIARTAKSITVQEDDHQVIGGKWPDLQYSYSPNTNGRTWKFRFSEKKGWIARGLRALVGQRRYYEDPTF